ncbi:MAG TPA: uroporphyrinogen decarboxylase family protein [Candidatus Acidoferrales bacterium]|nr:uroporphyrinogen decarboxylase family protein [Candidatus Acidoferrales bacterium]
MEGQPQGRAPAPQFEERAKAWKSAEGIDFISPAVRDSYERRVQMFIDVITLKKPERVPVFPGMGFYPFVYAGVTAEEAMHDYGKLAYALRKFQTDFLPDTVSGTALYGSGKILEILDYKLYRWPGHGVPPNEPYQCIEAEYMRADEYPRLINDPSDFFLRSYLPRVLGSLAPLASIGPITDILELPSVGSALIPFGLPQVQELLRKLLEAGRVALEWIEVCRAIDVEAMSTLGLAGLIGGFTKAPFDIIGDTMRGTRAIMLDKFRQPKAVLEAVERFVPLAIDASVHSAKRSRSPVVFIPLHKGADSFMSTRDFQTFYWPTLKAVILGLIKEGLIPYMFVEGAYAKRLDTITDPDIPPGRTIWVFDQTDLREVKKRFSGWACFGGNVPSSLLVAGTADEVSEHVKRLIDDVGRDGGYILSTGATVDHAKAENLHAMIDTGKEYGVLR